MLKLFDSYYDSKIAFEVFRLYLEDPSLLGILLEYTAPMIGFVARSEPAFHYYTPLDKEFIFSDIFAKMFFSFKEKGDYYPANRDSDFSRYLYRMVRNTMINCLRGYIMKELEGDPAMLYPQARQETYWDAEHKVIIEQRLQLVRDLFEKECRFDGNESKACVFLAECFLGMRQDNPKIVNIRYRINNAKKVEYLSEYTRVVLKDLIGYVREQDSQ